MKAKIVAFVCCIVFSAMAFAGGGGSSSGGGGGGGSASAVYTGTLNYKGSGGGFEVEASGPITVTINGNMVTVSFVTEVDGKVSGTAPASADGKSFIVPVKMTITSSGIKCTVEVIFNGTITPTTASGPISGKSSCVTGGAKGSLSISGNFNTTLSSSSRALLGSGFSSSVTFGD